MAFIVSTMSLLEEAAVYTPRIKALLGKYGNPERESPETPKPWLVDRERGLFFTLLRSHEVREPTYRYVLGIKDDIAVVRVPPGLQPRIEIEFLSEQILHLRQEALELAREALIVGGRYCRGVNNEVVDRVDPII